MAKTLSLFGATGSIGASTLKILQAHPDQFTLQTVTANNNAAELAHIAKTYGAKQAVVADPQAYQTLKKELSGTGIEAAAGQTALAAAAGQEVDIVIAGIVGIAGMLPTLEMARAAGTLALANKEALVCAGHLLLETAKQHNTALLPLDSEHNALFQALMGNNQADVARYTITASGGPFRDMPLHQLAHVTPAQATQHPVWPMGNKISVDSATMMNKGLEIIEACYLFAVDNNQIDVLIHPQAIIHGMVHYVDGSTLAQLSLPDMITPIAQALAYPRRLPLEQPPFDLTNLGMLTFDKPDAGRYPCLNLARQAWQQGAASLIALNAANEVAVAAFMQQHIRFTDIAALVETVLAAESGFAVNAVDDVLAIDQRARQQAHAVMSTKQPLQAMA